jgi:hypothetical protein
MTNLSGNGPTSEINNRPLPPARSNSWMIPLAAGVVIVVLGLGYGYSNGWMNSASTEQRASTTDERATGDKSLTTAPAPSMAPAATPKP